MKVRLAMVTTAVPGASKKLQQQGKQASSNAGSPASERRARETMQDAMVELQASSQLANWKAYKPEALESLPRALSMANKRQPISGLHPC